MKKIVLAFALMQMAFISASAFRIEYGNNITISQPVFENLYIAGGTVTINAPVHGDLICAGGTININDSVYNDILVAGGTVTFNGYVGDDIRCAGGQLYIQKSVTGDLVITGGKATVDKAVVIGGGLLMSGGDITFNGTVKDNVKAAAGNLIFTGTAEKDIDLRAGKIDMNGSVAGTTVLAAQEIIIGTNASFNNNVRFWNTAGIADFKSSVKHGQAVYDKSLAMESSKWYYLGGMTILGLLWYIGTALLMIAIIQYLFSNTLQKAGDSFYNATLKSLGSGLVFFICVPVLAIIAFITVIGIPIGLLLLFNYIVLLLLATIIAAVVGANWVKSRFNYSWNHWQLVLAALGIFVVLKIVSSVPFLGWITVSMAVCIAFGAIMQNIQWRKRDAALFES